MDEQRTLGRSWYDDPESPGLSEKTYESGLFSPLRKTETDMAIELEKGIRRINREDSDLDSVSVSGDDGVVRTSKRRPVDSEYQGNELSLRPVEPVDVAVRNLGLSFRAGRSMLSSLAPWKKNHNGPAVVRILNDISADIPSGSKSDTSSNSLLLLSSFFFLSFFLLLLADNMLILVPFE